MSTLARLLRVLALGVLAPAACTWIHPTEPLRAVPEEVALPQFEEIPVEFAHRWDRTRGHHLTGGSALDLDGDGRYELFVGGGEGQADALLSYHDGRLVDRIAGTGLSSDVASYGSIALDLDGDGDVDLLVARNDGVTVYRNEEGIFSGELLPIDLPQDSVPLAVSAADIDRDGDPDLYVSVFVDFPHFKAATFNARDHAKPNRLLRNDGGGRFTDITTPATASRQNTFTSAFADLDRDGFPDLVLAQNTGQVEILRNLGEGRFEDAGVDSGYGFWMGVAAGDADGDGDVDLLFTNVGDSFPAFLAQGDLRDDQRMANGWLLLVNDGGFRFHDGTRDAGLGGLGFAWGAAFEDVNFDGRLDLIVSQNYVKWPVHRVFKFPGKVLLGTGTTASFYPAPVAPNPAYSNAPLLADVDGDGRLDLFWLNNDGPSRAYLNRSTGNAVVVALADSPRSLGARAWLEGGPTRPSRELVSGAGLGTDSAAWLVLGLGAEERAGRLVVSFADGHTLRIDDPPINRPIPIE